MTTRADDTAIKIAMRTIERMGLAISSEKIREIIESDPDVVNAVNGYNSDADGFDTYDDGYFCMAIAKSVGFPDWPCNSDSDAHIMLFWFALGHEGYIPNYVRLPTSVILKFADQYFVENNFTSMPDGMRAALASLGLVASTPSMAQISAAEAQPVTLKELVTRILNNAFAEKSD